MICSDYFGIVFPYSIPTACYLGFKSTVSVTTDILMPNRQADKVIHIRTGLEEEEYTCLDNIFY